MAPTITLIPLGTSSAVPSATRNQSALAAILPSASTLLFDVGEGTQHQIQRFRSTAPHVKLGKIERIFITHLHGDHIFGLCPLLATLMNGAGGAENDPRLLGTNAALPADATPPTARVELYGPKGLREYVRANLTLTHTRLDAWYAVHELHLPSDAGVPSPTTATTTTPRYPKELPGTDIPADASTSHWPSFCAIPHPTQPHTPQFTLSASPIAHSVPSLGYVLTECPLPGRIPASYAKLIATHRKELLNTSGFKNPMEFLQLLQSPACPADAKLVLPDGTVLVRPEARRGRKITILGDTSDPSAIVPLALGSDVLVHEATNAFLPGLDPLTKPAEDYGFVENRTRERGHSTPEMAGRFARAIGLGEVGERGGLLVLNHFSSRYKDEMADGVGGAAQGIMGGIRRCAERAWVEGGEGSGLAGGEVEMGGMRVVCASDGVPIEVRD